MHINILQGSQSGGVDTPALHLQRVVNQSQIGNLTLEYVALDQITLTRVVNDQSFGDLVLDNVVVSTLAQTRVTNTNTFGGLTLALIPYTPVNAEMTPLLAAFDQSYSTTEKIQMDTFITGLKDAGVWAGRDWFGCAYWAKSEHDALINWINPAQTLVAVGAVSWTQGVGLKGTTPISNARYKSGQNIGAGPHGTATDYSFFCKIDDISAPQNAMQPMGVWRLVTGGGPAAPDGAFISLSITANTGFAGASLDSGNGNTSFSVGDGKGVWGVSHNSTSQITVKNGSTLETDTVSGSSSYTDADGMSICGSAGLARRSFPGTLMYWGWGTHLSAAQFGDVEDAFETAQLPPGVSTGVDVTVEQGGSQADPTSTDPIVFDVVFAEAVTGFTAADVYFTGSTATGMVANVSGSGATYTVSVSGMNASGTVVVSIPAGVATGVTSGDLNNASTSTDNSVTFALGYTFFDSGLSKSANVTLSNGNLTATSSSSTVKGATARHGKISGKWYFEASPTVAASLGTFVGWRAVGSTYAKIDVDATGAAGIFGVGSIYVDSAHNKTISSIQGQRVQIAIDLSAGKVWFRLNGTGNWNNTSGDDPATGVCSQTFNLPPGTAMHPSVNVTGSVDAITMAFDPASFTYSAPTGFNPVTAINESPLFVDVDSPRLGQATSTTSGTVQAVTNGPDRIIMLTVHSEKNAGSPTVTSVTDTSGLTWTRRKQFINGIDLLETWWAHAPTAITSPITITITFSAATDDATFGTFAVAGCNTSAPFDTNAGLPFTANGTSAQAQIANVSTTAADTILMALFGSGANVNPPPNHDSKYTLVNTLRNNGGTNWSNTSTEATHFLTAQTNITVKFATHTSNAWVMLVDAFKPA